MQVILNGTYLTSNSVFLTAIRNAALPQVVYTTTKRGGFHGNKLIRPTFASYKFVMEWTIIGSNFSDLAAKRRAFIGVLGLIHSTGSQTLQIITDDGKTLQIDIKAFDVSADITADDGVASAVITTFEAEYPFLQSSIATLQDFNLFNGGGFAIPFGIPFSMAANQSTNMNLTNNGNYQAYPILTFVGPLTNPGFKNDTTSDNFTISQTLADNSHSIVVDTYYRTVILQPSGNNGRQYFSGTFLTIPTGANSYKLTSSNSGDTGKVTVSFRDTFLGI